MRVGLKIDPMFQKWAKHPDTLMQSAELAAWLWTTVWLISFSSRYFTLTPVRTSLPVRKTASYHMASIRLSGVFTATMNSITPTELTVQKSVQSIDPRRAVSTTQRGGCRRRPTLASAQMAHLSPGELREAVLRERARTGINSWAETRKETGRLPAPGCRLL